MTYDQLLDRVDDFLNDRSRSLEAIKADAENLIEYLDMRVMAMEDDLA